MNTKFYILIVFTAALAVFLPSIGGEFLWDDELLIVHNPAIKHISNIPHFFTMHFFAGSFDESQFYRPLVSIFNTLQYSVTGLKPWSWHAVNFLLHALCSLLCFFLLKDVIELEEKPAFFGAVLFAVHPVHSESVSFISGRTDILVMIFMLGSILLYYSRKKFSLTASAIFFTAAVLCKELALVLPAVFLGLDYYREKEFNFSSWLRKRFPKSFLRILPLIIIGAVFLFIRFVLVKGLTVSRYPSGDFVTTWLTMPKVFFRYIHLSMVPWPLLNDYTSFFRIENSLLDVQTLSCLTFMIGFAVVAVLLFLRRNTVGLGMAWFLIFLLPVMNIFPIGLWMAERYLYVPVFGLSIVAAHCIKEKGKFRTEKWITPVISSIIIIYFFLGFLRLFAWMDEAELWRDALQKNPRNPQARVIYAQALHARGKHEKALEQLKKARIPEGASLNIQKRQTKAKALLSLSRIDEAKEALNKARAISPGSWENDLIAARIHEAEGNIQKAEEFYQKSYEKNPDGLGALFGLIHALAEQNYEPERLLKLCEKAIRLNPDYAPSYVYRGIALRKLQNYEKAMDSFRLAIQKAPDYAPAYIHLADLYESLAESESGYFRRAANTYYALLQYQPENIDAMNNLAIIYIRLGQTGKAESLWKRILEIDPDDEAAKANLRKLEESKK